MSRRTLLICLLCAPLLGGCVAAVVGAGAVTANTVHDRRSVGTVIDDQTVEIAVTDRIYGHKVNEQKRFASSDRIKVISHNGLVLLIGRVDEAGKIPLAGKLASKVNDVREVVNELEVGETAGLGTRIGDSFLTTKVKTAMFNVDIDGFDPTRVNVTTVNDVVYLMGLVTREEGEAAAEEASQVGGVDRVVKVFEYITIDPS